jgi:hypothetical protein
LTFIKKLKYIANNDKVPDDICGICLENLKDKPPNSCCGGYSKKFKLCNHWCHVDCQINKNINNRHKCPICNTEQYDKNIMDTKIKRARIIDNLPLFYRSKFRTEGISIFDNKKYTDDLIDNYGFERCYLDYIKNILSNT